MASLPDGVRPATRDLAVRLAAALSADHRREIADTGWLCPATSILLSLYASVEAYAFCPDGGAPVFMLGVEKPGALTDAAMVWMMGTEDVRRMPARTLRVARWGIRRAFAATGASRLEQYIPAWYTTGLRFASRLGFHQEPTGMHAIGGDALVRVVIERKEIAWE
jgi:hypothetical protein